jgi:uncharacterized protein
MVVLCIYIHNIIKRKEMNMPNLDGTGPVGQRPRRNLQRNNLGFKECICKKCGHKESHKRGIPCSQVKCPKCETSMNGENCS